MAELKRLTEVEHGRWAWVLEVVPDESCTWCGDDPRGVLQNGPDGRLGLASCPKCSPSEGAGVWCPLASDGVCRRADCLGDECPRARR